MVPMQTPIAAEAFSDAAAPSLARREAMLSALLAAALGAFLVLGVGFLHAAPVHDAGMIPAMRSGFPVINGRNRAVG
jgi:cobalt transporter subunit CbtB